MKKELNTKKIMTYTMKTVKNNRYMYMYWYGNVGKDEKKAPSNKIH